MADLIQTKEVNGKFYKNLKLSNMSLGQSIIVGTTGYEPKKLDTKYGETYRVTFDINGELVSTFLSPKQFKDYVPVQNSKKIKITKTATEIDTPKGKKVVGTYSFEPAEGTSPSAPVSTQLTEKQKMILKFMVDNNMKPTDRITVDKQVVTFEQYLGKNVVNNPEQYLK